jgi:hypothetical protein
LTTDTRSSKAKGKAHVRASLTTPGPLTMSAPSSFTSPGHEVTKCPDCPQNKQRLLILRRSHSS